MSISDPEAQPEQHPETGLTVYYDGSCPLCSKEIAYYRSRKGGDRLRLVDVSEETADTGADLARDTAMGRFHVRQPDGTLVSGAAAFAELWHRLPGWRVLGRIARLRAVNALLEICYRGFLPVRPVLSRLAGKRRS